MSAGETALITMEEHDVMQDAIHLSKAKQALLQKYLRGDLPHSSTESHVIARRAPGIAAPLSFGQEQIWIHAQLAADLPIYNEPLTIRRTGPLELAALKQSLTEIVRRHEAWRTNFATMDGQPVQVVHPITNLELPVVDLRELHEAGREAEALRLATEDARRPFNLEQGPLLRAMLVRLGDADHRLFMTLHQIIFDGVSMYSVFLPELATLYEAFVTGKPSPLPELPIQYPDFAYWQRHRMQDEALSSELVYWRQQLAGAPAALELPTDRPRPPIQTFNGEQMAFRFPQRLSEALKTLSRSEGTTLFMTLLAAFQALLHRYTQQDDLLIGTVTTSRKRSEFDELIGFFLNTLVLRTDLSGDPTFRELLGRVRKVTIEALAHGDLPVHHLVRELEREREASRNPLFQVMFVLEPPLPVPGPGWELSQVDVDAGIARVDLYLELDDRPEGLIGRFRYNSDLFDAASITRMLSHFRTLLEGVVVSPERSISDYPLSTEAERTCELIRSNSVRPVNPFTTFAKHEIEQSIPDRFESQVRRFPGHIAVKGRTHEWSYEELDRFANRVCQAILSLRGEGEERIALLLEHDAPMIAALLGTLKAGKTYVPLDPLYPRERLAYIVADSQAGALVTNDENLALAQQLTDDGMQLVNVDNLDSSAPVASAPEVPPDRLAYILYTSGSTGKPKGVMQNHRNLLHFIRVYTNNLQINSDDRLTLLSSYCFDAAVMDIYGALLNGATLYPVDIREEGLADLSGLLTAEEITIFHSTPTVYRYFVNTLSERSEFPQLRLVVLGGEEVNRRDVELYKKHFSDECLLVNGFGPTEATVSLQYFINKQTEISRQGVPVGYPVDDTEVLLLDTAGKPAEIYGEIAIRCEHVALGYWRNAKATDAAFLSDCQGIGSCIYRTGDMGRRLSDGSIEFEGRKDFQVKIRGFRVELGEIESALAEYPGLRESVVLAIQNELGEKNLVAYVVPLRESVITTAELRRYLSEKLPGYMLPSAFITLDSFPLTPTGKVDRQALRAADLEEVNGEREYVGPRDSLEYQLTKIWEQVLGRGPLGIRDDFFELGGHSILAVRLFAEIEKAFGKQLPLAMLFQAPTVEDMSKVLRQGGWQPPWSVVVAIQPSGTKPPFFCIHAAGANVLFYRDLSRRLGPDQPFYGIQPVGLNGKQPRHTCIEEMASYYIGEVRTMQPKGPYYLGGSSLGGIIAFEMACQLHDEGQEVAFLALFDSFGPGYPNFVATKAFRSRVLRLYRRVEHHLGSLVILDSRERISYVRQKLSKAKLAFLRWSRRSKKTAWASVYETIGRPVPKSLIETQDILSAVTTKYKPRPYSGIVTLFRASQQPPGIYPNPSLGWNQVTGDNLEIYEVPGYHAAIVSEPRVRFLIEPLQECLRRAQSLS